MAETLEKLGEGAGRTAVDLIKEGTCTLVINSPKGRGPRADGAYIRREAGVAGIPILTTAAAAKAAAAGMADRRSHPLRVRSLQSVHADGAAPQP